MISIVNTGVLINQFWLNTSDEWNIQRGLDTLNLTDETLSLCYLLYHLGQQITHENCDTNESSKL